jgi:hypothetical protein
MGMKNLLCATVLLLWLLGGAFARAIQRCLIRN